MLSSLPVSTKRRGGGGRRSGDRTIAELASSAFNRTGSTTGRSSCWTERRAFRRRRWRARMLGKRSLEKRCLSDGGPMVRIHLPPAESQQTFGSARDFRAAQCTQEKKARSALARHDRPSGYRPGARLGEMPYLWFSAAGSSVAHTDNNLDQHHGSPDTVEGYRRKYDRRADLPGQVGIRPNRHPVCHGLRG